MNLTIFDIAYHRNGIDGAPFHVVLFHDKAIPGSRKVGIVFEQPHHCAVLGLTSLQRGIIAFGANSWRGDHYEPYLRQAIARKNGEQP